MTQSKNIKESTNKKRKNLTKEKDKKKKLKITKPKEEKIHDDDNMPNEPNILDAKKDSDYELEIKNVQGEKKKNNLDILKRGRKFVDKDTMMNLIDQLNEKEDERIEKKLQRQNNLEQIMENRQIKQQRNQSVRKEKIENVKRSIKNKKRKKPNKLEQN
ncbi:hypothetical protein C1645_757387 [Glomus cerebriforme]|uniref:Uncharacterized protein n=1 Tax=Glomus cerebriforme TaxID=658196 RepID=A0A397TC79_9GLOM|nr:hypothetical protein C1645_757387 [Glomus cerebriforme]